ncbi:adenylate/guanylate cyclase domain-containing protein [Mesorhizobium sp. B2-4-15]|uniref:adenylate/guanylate cyclase domain-containing protein n=1 Tax=Mesorhizobium sp. B2-4-15 TaxID=2589934 RepID=UPI001FEDD22A|nr:adenylate/guanylate cyclase domain-containing protein [Mesorhizobium sp. B2-4-15]
MGTITHFATTSFRFLVTDRERRAIRRAFGQYLSPSLLYRIEHTRNALRLGGGDRELTVMFVDVRNFTEISERLPPTAVVRFLNTRPRALSLELQRSRVEQGPARQRSCCVGLVVPVTAVLITTA